MGENPSGRAPESTTKIPGQIVVKSEIYVRSPNHRLQAFCAFRDQGYPSDNLNLRRLLSLVRKGYYE